MILPTWFSLLAFFVAAIAGGMACLLFVKRQVSTSHRSLASLLGATTVVNLANGVGLLDEAHALLWRETALVAELVQPAALLYVGLAFLNPAERGRESSALWRARIIGVVGLLLAVFAVTGQVLQWKTFEMGQPAIALASWGHVPYVFVVIGMTLGLAQLEVVLRASREPVRHKLKFVIGKSRPAWSSASIGWSHRSRQRGQMPPRRACRMSGSNPATSTLFHSRTPASISCTLTRSSST